MTDSDAFQERLLALAREEEEIAGSIEKAAGTEEGFQEEAGAGGIVEEVVPPPGAVGDPGAAAEQLLEGLLQDLLGALRRENNPHADARDPGPGPAADQVLPVPATDQATGTTEAEGPGPRSADEGS